VAGLGLACPEVDGAVEVGCEFDGLELTAGELDGLGLGGGGLVAGRLDGPGVPPGTLDGLEWGVGLGRGAGLAHADELRRTTVTGACLGPERPVPACLGLDELDRLDGLALELAGDEPVGLGLAAGDEPFGLGLAAGDEPPGLGLAAGDEPPGLGLAAGDGLVVRRLPGAGAASAGGDDVQPAAG
jgi:hypothetical protein